MIRDNPTLQDLYNASVLLQFLPKFRPLMWLMGKNGREAARLTTLVPSMVRDVREAITIPDRFNASFASRGWVAYWGLGIAAARGALEISDEGDIDAAEQFLADYYDRDVLEEGIASACASSIAFGKRERLLRKAMEDHLEGRYHASVPVVLAQIDGIAIDLTGRYFFANRRIYTDHADHMTAVDTIAGHPSGLRALAEVLGEYRGQTTAQPLVTPYRHGVAHGRDLEYDTKLVSSKCFAALLAVAEWAEKVERGKQFESPELVWPDIDKLSSEDMWRELRAAWWATYDAEKRRYMRWRRPGQEPRRMARERSIIDRINERYGITPR